MIEKNLGCPHMRCKCGHSFRWTSISPDEPCCQLHIMEGIRYHGLKKGMWGAPCANATPLTRARLGAYRATIAVGAAPLAAAVAALAAAAIAATAPVWGPVVAVAAVRRRRRRRKARERRRLTHPNFEATRRTAVVNFRARRRTRRRGGGRSGAIVAGSSTSAASIASVGSPTPTRSATRSWWRCHTSTR